MAQETSALWVAGSFFIIEELTMMTDQTSDAFSVED